MNEANVGVWTMMGPADAREAHTKGRITTLIYLSKEGDTKAEDRLLHEFTPTIEMLAKDMRNRNNPDADLEQAIEAGKEAFRRALRNYDYKTPFEAHMKLQVIYDMSRFLTQ
ncbi:Uncharacterised protein [uncultured archaeon]|nr:Uncharacterised protein [uncultured archaeon]